MRNSTRALVGALGGLLAGLCHPLEAQPQRAPCKDAKKECAQVAGQELPVATGASSAVLDSAGKLVVPARTSMTGSVASWGKAKSPLRRTAVRTRAGGSRVELRGAFAHPLTVAIDPEGSTELACGHEAEVGSADAGHEEDHE